MGTITPEKTAAKRKGRRPLDRYRRHVELYGPEGVLQAAEQDLTGAELVALERFLKQRGHRARIPGESVDGLARRIMSTRRECECMDVYIDRARTQGARPLGKTFEQLVSDRDQLRRTEEDLISRLKVRFAIDGKPAVPTGSERVVQHRGNKGLGGHRQRPPDPGETFDRLVVDGTVKQNGRTYVVCHCICPEPLRDPVLVSPANLRNGSVKSCGCLKLEYQAELRARAAKRAAET
jgi:hypothetical protein